MGSLPRAALAVALALVAMGHLWLFRGAGPVDDDFICYRYARHLLEGQGLVFNVGQRVEGFTNPLWVGLLALGQALGQGLGLEPIALSRALGLVAAALAVLFVAWSQERTAGPGALLAPLAVTLSPALAFHGAAGLGTTLLGALLAGWFAAWRSAERAGRSPRLAAVLLTLACLLRPEALVFALPFAWGARSRLAGGAPLAAMGLLVLARLAYYGELLPLTYHAKRLPLAEDLAYGLRYLWTSTWVALVGPWVLLALVAALRSRPAGLVPRPTAMAALGLALHTLYVVASGGDYIAQARFFAPTLPLAMALAGLALSAAGLGRALLALLALAPLWAHGRFADASPLTPHTRPYLHLLNDFQEQRWAALGQVFRAAVPPDSSVCLSPIGAFGWESRLEVVDVLGLTDPAVARAEPDLTIGMKGHHRHEAQALLAREPDYVIPGNGVRDPLTGQLAINPWERDLFLHPRFAAEYQRALVPVPGGAPVDVWVRRGAPLPAGGQLVR